MYSIYIWEVSRKYSGFIAYKYCHARLADQMAKFGPVRSYDWYQAPDQP